jgi:hypothetical protein
MKTDLHAAFNSTFTLIQGLWYDTTTSDTFYFERPINNEPVVNIKQGISEKTISAGYNFKEEKGIIYLYINNIRFEILKLSNITEGILIFRSSEGLLVSLHKAG